jgi:3D-(3,5/4)-trihydroxycyclohexane-1,2-dione acylhydrolase (decyclizing)
VIVIETDPARSLGDGGAWWDVPVAEVSARPEVRAVREAYDAARRRQRPGHQAGPGAHA